MADRFWVDDGGDWDDATNHWAAASGGAPGAAEPTAADDVHFDANSFTIGGQTVTLTTNEVCRAMDWTEATDNPTFDLDSNTITQYGGNVTIIAAMTFGVGNGRFEMYGNGGHLAANGTTLDCELRIGYESAWWNFLDDNLVVTGNILLDRKRLNTQTFNITCDAFVFGSGFATRLDCVNSTINCTSWDDNGVGAKTLNAAGSTINVSGTGDFDGDNLTYNDVNLTGTAHTITGDNTFASLTIVGTATITLGATTQTTGTWLNSGTIAATTGTIIVTGTGAFQGNGETYYNVELNGTAHTISGSNTFSTLTFLQTQTQTITFTDGTDQTVTTPVWDGESGHVHTLTGSGVAGWTCTKAGGGTVEVDWIALSYSAGTPANTWFYGANSSYGVGVTGWNLAVGPFLPITYEIMVDWDMTDWTAAPDFSQAIDDISADVNNIRWLRGDDREEGNIPASTLELTIIPSEYAKYSVYNAAGDLYGKLLPWKVVRIRATHQGTTYNIFFGYISKIKCDPNPQNPSAYIYVTDGIDLLARTLITQDENIRETMTDGAAVGKVLDAAGWSATRRDLDIDGGEIFQYPETSAFKE